MERYTKERNSNLELLRIVSIIMILILHYLNRNMGGALKNTLEGTTNYYVIRFIESLSIIAVNCFVLISAYFMVNKDIIKLNKIINLIFISIFYGCILYIVSIVIKIQQFNLQSFGKSLIFIYGSKWFLGSYIILCLLSPFLNKIIKALNRDNYKKLLIIVIIAFSIIPTLFSQVSYNDRGYGVLNFITLYFIGGYLRLHYQVNKSRLYYFIVYLLCSLMTTLMVISKIKIIDDIWWCYNSIFNIISSISLFLFFLKLNIKSYVINYLATFCFPIYIIHSDNSINTFLYRFVFKSEKYWNHPDLLVNMSKTVLGIFLGCILIESIRRIIIKPISTKINISDMAEVSI